MKINVKFKTIEKLEDFAEVYSEVFGGAPYFEKYTDEELEELFNQYSKNGYIEGAYSKVKNGKDECIGLLVVENGIQEGHPIEFKTDSKIGYLAEVAVKQDNRQRGLGSLFFLTAIFKELEQKPEILYMRTLKDGSMSKSIAEKFGFEMAGNIQKNETIGLDGKPQIREDIFLALDLKSPKLRINIEKFMKHRFGTKQQLNDTLNKKSTVTINRETSNKIKSKYKEEGKIIINDDRNNI